eukprot:m.41947 g.41947  ORF g.41947 m.41947 type:complete len:111 (+) comp33307_c0_seq2:37-369(+)
MWTRRHTTPTQLSGQTTSLKLRGRSCPRPLFFATKICTYTCSYASPTVHPIERKDHHDHMYTYVSFSANFDVLVSIKQMKERYLTSQTAPELPLNGESVNLVLYSSPAYT